MKYDQHPITESIKNKDSLEIPLYIKFILVLLPIIVFGSLDLNDTLVDAIAKYEYSGAITLGFIFSFVGYCVYKK